MANSEHERRLRDAAQAKASAADLSGCDLSGISFSSIRIAGASLRGADLRGADLSGGYFQGCDLRKADCRKSFVQLSDLREADLTGANLTGADWTRAVLTGANLSQANLHRARLVKARLDGAILTGANLNGTDLRGAQGLTAEQIHLAKNVDKAILDERTLTRFGRSADPDLARHGIPTRKKVTPWQVDLLFTDVKPRFGDVFLLCGDAHPSYPSSGDYGFNELADLGIEQVGDHFAVCVDGDPAVWIFPLVRGQPVIHHPGPFDGLRVEADGKRHRMLWAKCAARITTGLRIPVSR
jgi:hypothetical protein